MDNIRQQKTTLLKILTGNASFVLQHVDAAKLITVGEYNNLKDTLKSHNRQDFMIDLLDTLINKGDKLCHKFLELLENDGMQETFPLLSEHLVPPAMRPVDPVRGNTDTLEVNAYKMSSTPRGVCVIINNMHFDLGAWVSDRRGSEVDVECLNEVFKWLGFTVEVHSDKTSEDMMALLKGLSQKEHEGDCFVCCIFSHHCKDGFYGIEGGVVNSSDILKLFARANCPSLADKPKVFILHNDWDHGEHAIPDSDFLLALATVKGLHSYRHIRQGSWFIQSLYKMLKEGCKRGDDVITILCRVIEEVGTLDKKSIDQTLRQIPHIDFTLRKKLFFNVPDSAHGDCKQHATYHVK